jgi:hypothetical protein
VQKGKKKNWWISMALTCLLFAENLLIFRTYTIFFLQKKEMSCLVTIAQIKGEINNFKGSRKYSNFVFFSLFCSVTTFLGVQCIQLQPLKVLDEMKRYKRLFSSFYFLFSFFFYSYAFFVFYFTAYCPYFSDLVRSCLLFCDSSGCCCFYT